MLDINVLFIQYIHQQSNTGRTVRRLWRIVPFTTTVSHERAWRKRVFWESLSHEWKSIVYSSWFDLVFLKQKRRRRYFSRTFWRMNHPHSGTRQLADAYVSHVGISSGR
jgi:hypothetical protein